MQNIDKIPVPKKKPANVIRVYSFTVCTESIIIMEALEPSLEYKTICNKLLLYAISLSREKHLFHITMNW